MQSMKLLHNWLFENANEQHYIFKLGDLRALLPKLSDSAFKTLLSRSVTAKILTRVCRGIYLFKSAMPADGLLLFHVAAILRADEFNYVSLETVLSDSGIISQVPINWITIMSSGRSNIISCGEFGTIEFIHTNKKPHDLIQQLSYDNNCGLWRANIKISFTRYAKMPAKL